MKAYVNSKSSGKPVHPHSFPRTFAVHSHNRLAKADGHELVFCPFQHS